MGEEGSNDASAGATEVPKESPLEITAGYSMKNLTKDEASSSVKTSSVSKKREGRLGSINSSNRSTVTKSFLKNSQSGWDEFGDPSAGVKQLVSISSTRASRVTALIGQSMNLDDEGEKVRKCCCIPITNNVKALFIMMVLFAVISIAQYFAANAANSQALRADVVSMAVDAVSYFGNILGEGSDIPSQRIVLQLCFSIISFALLLGFNTKFIIESVETVRDFEEKPDDDSAVGVDGKITIAFAGLGLVFDFICLGAYYYYAKKDAETEYQAMLAASAAEEDVDEEAKEGTKEGKAKIKKPQVNMLSALFHVSADLLRSTSTFVEGIILLAGGLTNSREEFVDGIISLIICSSIYLGSIYAMCEWFLSARKWFVGLGATITVPCPECSACIEIKPDKAGPSKAKDALLA